MKKPFMYFPDSDTLEITLAHGPVSKTENAGIDGEHDNILFSYDDQGRIVSITIDAATQAVNLSDITRNKENAIAGRASEIFTVSSLAKLWNISPRTIQKTVRSMLEAGIAVGVQNSAKGHIVLTEADAHKIDQWRKKHPRGRPKRSHASEIKK